MSDTAPDNTATQGQTPVGLYLLILGITLGVVLGPGVLGRFAPRTYEQLFIGGSEARAALDAFNVEADDKLARIQETGVTYDAVQELQLTLKAQSMPLQHRYDTQVRDHGRKIAALAVAVVLLMIITMIIETFTPAPGSGPGNVSAAGSGCGSGGRAVMLLRYALAAIWIALVLARPSMLTDIGLWF